MVVIDAQGAVVGRLSARVAKMLLMGSEVEIINADKAIMLGTIESAKEKFESRRSQKNKRNPDESPKWPRIPYLLMRRMVRGMLPWKSQRGRDAYHRLRVAAGANEGSKAGRIKEASGEGKHGTFTLGQLCAAVGGRQQ